MSIIQGNLLDSSKKHSIFFTNNPDFEYVGLCRFTIESIYQYCKFNQQNINKTNIDPKIKNLLIGSLSSIESFKSNFLQWVSSAYYYEFSLSEKKYIQKEYDKNKLFTLISEFEKINVDPNYGNNEVEKEVFKIQNSQTKCLLITLSINYIVADISLPIQLKLFFNNNTDYLSGERKVASKVSNIVVGIPRTPAGTKFNPNNNNLTGKSDEIGNYTNPSQDGENNPKNMVGAPLKLVFNKSLGTWESGTQQILAKLITDIDPAPIKKVDLTNNSVQNFFSPDSDVNFAGHTTGKAIPLNVQDNNPYLYGPNCFTCGEDKKVETIMVVNRSLEKYTKGSIVACSLIGAEWIIIKEFKNDIATVAKVQDWSFSKFIVNSDGFFRASGVENNIQLTSDIYEQNVRQKFYDHLVYYGNTSTDVPQLIFYENPPIPRFSATKLLNDFDYSLSGIVSINKLNIDTKISGIFSTYYYYQSTIFDQLGNWMGGNSINNFIGNTNLSVSSNINELPMEHVPFFWGPVFVDGYTINSIQKLKSFEGKTLKTNNETFFSTDASFYPLLNDDGYTGLITKDKPWNILFPPNDPNLAHLPAEVGILSKKSPIENISFLPNLINASENFTSKIIYYLYSQNRFANLTDNENNDVYALEPVNPNKIQFSPLQAEFAAHSDAYATSKHLELDFIERNFFDTTRSLLKSSYSNITDFWGKMFSRVTGRPMDGSTDVIKPNCFVYNHDQESKKFKNVPYDCYITQDPLTKPIGVPDLFLDEYTKKNGANLVGIIGAKNTIIKRGGGPVTFSLDQLFGLRPYLLSFGGKTDVTSLIGFFFSSSTTPIQSRSYPQWGSENNDKYNTFGTTALHVRIFDSWPKELTIYDPRYFSVFHFNYGDLFSIPSKITTGKNSVELAKQFKDTYTKWNDKSSTYYHAKNPSYFNYERSIDQITYTSDFRVPTYAGLPGFTEDDNTIIPTGTVINQYNYIRPENEWRVNTICRGQLLTGGGFKYKKRKIGLCNSFNTIIIDGGSGFTNGQIVDLPNKVSIILNVQNGIIQSINYNKDSNGNEMRGEGFLPENFTRTETIGQNTYTGYFVNIPATEGNTNNKPAKLCFPNGIVYESLEVLLGPQERCPITRLSSSSSSGDMVKGNQTTSISLDDNGTGEYDAFYFFHNDITHTTLFAYGQLPGFVQHITMTIS